jgi:hypothetical protein
MRRFIPLGFEDVLATSGHRPQDLINNLVDACDIFVLAYHRRWGQSSPDVVGHTSYTDEEFGRATRRFTSKGRPEIFCLFKHVDLAALADPGTELTKVLEFRKRLERSGSVLYRTFSRLEEFVSNLENHLAAFTSSTLPGSGSPRAEIVLPIIADLEPETEWSQDLAILEGALHSAQNGRREEASVLFARLSQTSRSVQVIDAARQFFEGTGNADAAQTLLERKVTLLRDRRLAAHEYMAVLTSKGVLEQIASRVDARTAEVFRSGKFKDLMLDSMAEYFTVGELLALARFYSGDGGTITSKFGEYITVALPKMLKQLE